MVTKKLTRNGCRALIFPALIAGLIAPGGAAHAEQNCGNAAFSAVVAQAGAELNAINSENKKAFQDKLQKLKGAQGWSEADYVAKATPYVKDEKTAGLDAANAALLAKVQTLGGGDAGTEQKRCAMLAELQTLMQEVVSNTRAKWQHMLAKADAGAGPAAVHAGAGK